MKRYVIVTLTAFVVLAPAARASDDSLKTVVRKEQPKLEQAAANYAKKVKTVKTDAQIANAKRETNKLIKVTATYHDAVKGEQADSAKYKTARTKLLDALSTYKRGLNKLISALDAKSTSKLKSAFKTLESSGKKFRAAARAFS